MKERWRIGDLAVMTASVPEFANEHGHVWQGDVVTVVRIHRHLVRALTEGGKLATVWGECTIEAPDGTVWSAILQNLKKVDPPDEPGSWEELEDIWEPA